MEDPQQENLDGNQLTYEIEIKPEKDDEFDDQYVIGQYNLFKNSPDGRCENIESTLTSELSIKYEPPEAVDDEFIDYRSEESKCGVENRLIFKAGPDTAKKIAVRRLFLYQASVQCGTCSQVTTSWEDWCSHVLRHKAVIAVPDSHKSEVRKPVRRDRVHYCVFCHRDIRKFARHMFRKHSNEMEIQRIKCLPPLSQERKKLLSNLRKKGNFLYRSENPRAVRSSPCKNIELLPCISCMGFYSASYLSRHRKKCCRGLLGVRVPHMAMAQNFLLKDAKVDPELRETVFMRMRPDKVSMVAKLDPIICECAAEYLRKSRNTLKTSVKMRELAKFLMCARNLEPSIKKMVDLLRTYNYSVIVRAIKILSRKEVDMDNVPLIVRNIIASLKQCCDIAIRRSNIENSVDALSDVELQRDIRKLRSYIHFKLKADIIGQKANDDDTKSSQVDNQAVQKVFQHWTAEQKNIVISHFDTNLKTKVPPTKEDCIKLRELYPDLFREKSWLTIHKLVKSCIFTKKDDNDNDGNKTKKRVLIQWTTEQKSVANSFFREHINNGFPPRKYECVKLIQLHKDLFWNKNWKKIKVYVQNQYVRNSKGKPSTTDNLQEPGDAKPREDLNPSDDDGKIIVEDVEVDPTSSEAEKELETPSDGVPDQASMFEPGLVEELMDVRFSCDEENITHLEVDSRETVRLKNRINKKMRFCCFCEAKVENYARHLISSHRRQVKVRNFLCTSVYDPGRNILLAKFKRQKPFVGVKNRYTTKNTHRKFILCRNCQGYFRDSLFKEHRVQCKKPLKYLKRAQQNLFNTAKDKVTPSFDAIRKSFDFYDSLSIKDIIQTIRLDETVVVGIGDVLICRYADQVYKKATGATVRHVVSNTIRELGKILIELRTATNYDNLIDNLRPELYDSLFEATKKISGYNSESKAFQYSYLPVKMGKVFKDISGLAIKMIRKEGDVFELKGKDQTITNLERLMTLIQHHWSSDLVKLESAKIDESVVSSETPSSEESDDDKFEGPDFDQSLRVPRIRFTDEEKKAIRSYFKKHIQKKQSPKKLEVLEFMSEHKTLFKSKNWVKIKAFVYNEYRLK